MPQFINTNMSALTGQRNLNKSQMANSTAMQRLSSGLRINSAKDDAAGLAIADRMTSQIKGLNQASRNANDGITLAQTAEGALGEVGNSLQRLRELAVQSANATNTASDRASLQEEASQLLSEIDRVATQTEFNGTKLLDGSFKAKSFQIGANAGQQLSVTVNAASTKALGTGDASALTARANDKITGAGLLLASGTPGSVPSLAAGDVILNGIAIGASVASADNKSFAANSGSSIAKAAAFNAVSSQTGVTATVNETTVEGVSMTAAATDGVIDINGVQTSAVFTTTDTSATRKAVVSAINAISDRTGVTAVDSETDAGGVKLSAIDGRNISVGFDAGGGTATLTAASTGLNAGATNVATATSNSDAGYNVFMGTYTLSSSADIKAEEGTGNIGNAGLQAGTYGPQQAYASTKSLQNAGVPANTGFAAGDFKINGVLIGQTLASSDKASSVNGNISAISKAAAINALTGQTGVSATVNATVASSTVAQTNAGGLTGTITINGVASASITSTTDAASNRAAVVKAINDISGQTGVTAVDTHDTAAGKGVQLQAADGRNIDIGPFGGTMTAAEAGIHDDTNTTPFDPVTKTGGPITGSITLSSGKAFTIERGTTANDVTTTLGLEVGSYGTGKTGQSLNTINIGTAAGATAALTAIDNALASVNSSRGTLGAVQNRFTSTISSLQTTSENLTAARSRIQDTDFAAETAELSRTSILQQAGTAMLAQANQSSQGVLSLLR
ncbi:MAG: flagellin [Methylobacter sp.]|nr:MAG: flagellin [Methylobacter sp.]